MPRPTLEYISGLCTVCSAGASIAVYGRAAHIPLARNSGHFQKRSKPLWMPVAFIDHLQSGLLCFKFGLGMQEVGLKIAIERSII